MKKRNMYKPVVTDKPKRALSVETIQVPGEDDVFLKAYTADNKPIFVPAKNLESMRNFVNLHIRERGESMASKTPDFKSEKKELQRYMTKLEDLARKLDHYEKDSPLEYDGLYSSDLDSELIHNMRKKKAPENIEQPAKIPKYPSDDRSVTHISCSEALKELIRKKTDAICTLKESGTTKIDETQPVTESASETYVLKEDNLGEPTKLSKTSLTMPPKEETKPDEFSCKPTSVGKTSDSTTVKFFICGYLKNGIYPLFIIQSYNGDSLLANKKSHLDQKQTFDGVDVLVSGKFYSRNIVQAVHGVPKSLRIENREMLIDKKGIIFEEGVTDALSTDELLIALQCSFIKNIKSTFYTPALFIGVERKPIGERKLTDRISISKWVSLKEAFFNNSTISTYNIETRGFTCFPTHVEGGETIYESFPLRKRIPGTLPEMGIKDEEGGVYEFCPKSYFDNQSFSRSVCNIDSKTIYGNDAEDNSASEKVYIDRPTINNKEAILYECGTGFKYKSEISLAAGLGTSQSKTEYGDIEGIITTSSETTTNIKNASVQSKHRKTDLLRRINKIIFSKLDILK